MYDAQATVCSLFLAVNYFALIQNFAECLSLFSVMNPINCLLMYIFYRVHSLLLDRFLHLICDFSRVDISWHPVVESQLFHCVLSYAML
jgi:hypothetical protein